MLLRDILAFTGIPRPDSGPPPTPAPLSGPRACPSVSTSLQIFACAGSTNPAYEGRVFVLFCFAPLVLSFPRGKSACFQVSMSRREPTQVLITVSRGEYAAPSDQNVTGHHSPAGPACESAGGRAGGPRVPHLGGFPQEYGRGNFRVFSERGSLDRS